MKEESTSNRFECKFIHSLDGCDGINRMIDALKYYSTLNIHDEEDQDKLSKYFQDKYPNYWMIIYILLRTFR